MKCPPHAFVTLCLLSTVKTSSRAFDLQDVSSLSCGSEGLERGTIYNETGPGSYTVEFVHPYFVPVIDILPVTEYTGKISHEPSAKQISAFVISIAVANVTEISEAGITDVFSLDANCEERSFPITFKFNLRRKIALCFTMRIKIFADSSYQYVIRKLCTPPDNRIYIEVTDTTEITSPGYPASYRDNMNLTYILYTKTNVSIHVKFREFELERPYGEMCFDYVYFETAEVTSKHYCGHKNSSQLQEMAFSSEYFNILIHFISDNKFVSTGFKADANIIREKDCNYTTTDMNGTIMSSEFFGVNHSFEYCSVYIQLPENYRIIVISQYIDDPKGTDIECNTDIVTIFSLFTNNTSKEHRLQCLENSTMMERIQSLSSTILVHFLLNKSNENETFVLRYYGVQTCDNVTFRQDNGVIQSSNFPHDFSKNRDCIFTIHVVSVNSAVELVIKEFNTESLDNRFGVGPFCNLDFIEIYTDVGMYRICGHFDGRGNGDLKYLSKSGTIRVKFLSHESNPKFGFYAVWRAIIQPSLGGACASIVETDKHRFEFFGNLVTWENGNRNCRERGGRLMAVLDSDTQQLLEQFIRNSENCTFNFDSFWIGANDRAREHDFRWTDGTEVGFTNWFPGWQLYNNTNKQPSDDGFSNEDCIEMRRNYYFPRNGMGLTEKLYWNDRNCDAKNSYICQQTKDGVTYPIKPDYGCNKVYNLHEDNLHVIVESPGYPSPYRDSLNCRSTVKAPVGYTLMLSFLHFNLEYEPGCHFDNLTVSSVPGDEDGVTYCGDRSDDLNRMYWKSQTNFVFLHFQTDESKTASGYSINISAVHVPKYSRQRNCTHLSNCRAMYADEPNTFHGASSLCQANEMKMTSNLKSTDIFNQVQFLNSISDKTDFVIWDARLHEDGNLIKGNQCQAVNITFILGCTYPQIFVQKITVPCNSKLNYFCIKSQDETLTTKYLKNTSGIIRFPSTASGQGRYDNNENLVFALKANTGFRILLHIFWYDIELARDCRYDYLILSDVKTLHRLCGYNRRLPLHVVSKYNWLNVSFRSDDSVVARGFSFSWRFIRQATCIEDIYENGIGTLTGGTEFLMSNDISNCCIAVSAPRVDLGISLWLQEIHLAAAFRCNESNLEIYDGNEFIARICPGQHTTQKSFKFLSSSNELKLCFSSVNPEDRFTGKYTYVPPSKKVEIENYIRITPNTFNGSTTISSMHYPNTAPSESIQVFVLRVQLGFSVTLSLTDIHFSEVWNCQEHYLEIYDDSPVTTDARLIGNISCNGSLHHGGNLSSFLNRLVLRFTTGDTNNSLVYFTADYHVQKDDSLLERTADVSNYSFDECIENSTCINDGGCVEKSKESFFCRCLIGYRGMFCQSPYCDETSCTGGSCENSTDFHTCTCDADTWGPTCNLTFIDCGLHFCSGRGSCSGVNKWKPKCRCFLGWEGEECSDPSLGSLTLIGERLLKEPIWVGMIVILSLLFLFGVLFLLKKKCGTYFTFCKDTMDMLRHREDGIPAHRNDPISQSPTCSFHSEIYQGCQEKSTTLYEDKEDNANGFEDEVLVITPAITLNNQEAAARLFDSLRFNAVFPFEKIPKTSEFNDSSVGGLVEGTLAFNSSEKDLSLLNSPPTFSKHKQLAQSLTSSLAFGRQTSSSDDASLSINRSHTIAVDNPSTLQSFDKIRHCFPEAVVTENAEKYELDYGKEGDRKPEFSSTSSYHLMNVREKRNAFAGKDSRFSKPSRTKEIFCLHDLPSPEGILFSTQGEKGTASTPENMSFNSSSCSKKSRPQLTQDTENSSVNHTFSAELDDEKSCLQLRNIRNSLEERQIASHSEACGQHSLGQKSRKKHHRLRIRILRKDKLYQDVGQSRESIEAGNVCSTSSYFSSLENGQTEHIKRSCRKKHRKLPSLHKNHPNLVSNVNVSSFCESNICCSENPPLLKSKSLDTYLKDDGVFNTAGDDSVTDPSICQESADGDYSDSFVTDSSNSDSVSSCSNGSSSSSYRGRVWRRQYHRTIRKGARKVRRPRSKYSCVTLPESSENCTYVTTSDGSLQVCLREDSAVPCTENIKNGKTGTSPRTEMEESKYESDPVHTPIGMNQSNDCLMDTVTDRYQDGYVHRQLKLAAIKLAAFKTKTLESAGISKDSAIVISPEQDTESDSSFNSFQSLNATGRMGIENLAFALEKVSEEGHGIQNQELTEKISENDELIHETHMVDLSSASVEEQIEMQEFIV